MAPNDEIGRRELLIFGVGLTLGATGCTPAGASRPSATPATSGPRTSASPASPTTPLSTSGSPSPSSSGSARSASLPRIESWQPSSNDIQPAVKLTAVRVIEAIGSWHAGGMGTRAAEARVAALGQPGGLASQARPLLGVAEQAVVQVIDAQYGGILANRASVLVPCKQWRLNRGVLTPSGTTVDVRLSRAGGRWQVTALHPAAPGPADPTPSALATRVLSSSKITLPPAAAADVRAGRVHDSVLTAMLALADDFAIGVSVIRSGHPRYVFGTSRPSDHPRGRAFDTWQISGHQVVDPGTPKKLITDYMWAVAAAGSYNIGGPYQLSGPGNRFFSDATHHDHVHAGFLA